MCSNIYVDATGPRLFQKADGTTVSHADSSLSICYSEANTQHLEALTTDPALALL